MRSSAARGLILRGVAAYGLPHCLRLTVGSEDANRAASSRPCRIRERANDEAPLVRQGRADRHRPDRLVDGACACQARRTRRRISPATTHTPEMLERATQRRLRGLAARRISATAVRDADLVDPGRARRRLRRTSPKRSAPHLKPGAIVSDVGSVKARRAARCRAASCPNGVHFIPAHPIAGTEQSGPEAGFAELFDGRWCILTPPPGADAAARRDAESLLGSARQQGRDDGCRSITISCSRSPAMCRI